MHDTAFAIGRKFFELYGDKPGLQVVEVGSQDVNGTLRDALPRDCEYIGVDLEPGKNVDLVSRGTHIALPDGTADLTVASSTFEHDPLFWMTFLELCRITKPSGFIYLNAPSNGTIHRHPVDCWRFYPDAAPALAAWARSQGFAVTCVESFTAERKGDLWNDFVAVFTRGPMLPRREAEKFVHGYFPCANIIRCDGPETLSPASESEDSRLLSAAMRALVTLEARAAEVTALPGGRSKSETRDVRQLGYVHRMMRHLGASSGTRVPRFAPGELGPFEDSFRTIYRALDAAEDAARQSSHPGARELPRGRPRGKAS